MGEDVVAGSANDGDEEGSKLLEPKQLAALAPLGGTAFFFDVDGTVLDIRARPEQVVADRPLRTLLGQIRDKANGALALVSGRTLADLDRIFMPMRFTAAGTHGAELRRPDATVISAQGEQSLDFARPDIHYFVGAHPGLLLEDKGQTLAVHFRQVPTLEHKVFEFLDAFTEGKPLAVQRGKMVAELKSVAFDKGTAIDVLMKEPPFADRKPLFVGDDVTDEKGFAYVNRRGGISVRIGPSSDTLAMYRLESPDDFRRELSAMNDVALQESVLR